MKDTRKFEIAINHLLEVIQELNKLDDFEGSYSITLNDGNALVSRLEVDESIKEEFLIENTILNIKGKIRFVINHFDRIDLIAIKKDV